jgi:hypothetical protein
MPAPFINDLCGYRASNGELNVSDNNDSGSKELSRALFDVLHISADARASDDPGAAMEDAILRDLQVDDPISKYDVPVASPTLTSTST